MNDDKRMIQRPGNWVQWPLLPLKRYTPGNPMEVGLLIDRQPIGVPIDPEHVSVRTVVLINMFDVDAEKLKAAERKEYATVDAMLADGWIVD